MKIRTLKSRLSGAGFILLPKRGKGSHSIWRHPLYQIAIVQSGKDNSDAKPYQVKTLKLVFQKIAKLRKINHDSNLSDLC
jgi:predicted RNA binding protein YcfA (HicA-like mRNA interferase family)